MLGYMRPYVRNGIWAYSSMVEQWSPKPSIEVRVLVGPPETGFKKVCLFFAIVYNRLNMIEQPQENKGEIVPQDFVEEVLRAYNQALESLANNPDGS